MSVIFHSATHREVTISKELPIQSLQCQDILTMTSETSSWRSVNRSSFCVEFRWRQIRSQQSVSILACVQAWSDFSCSHLSNQYYCPSHALFQRTVIPGCMWVVNIIYVAKGKCSVRCVKK